MFICCTDYAKTCSLLFLNINTVAHFHLEVIAKENWFQTLFGVKPDFTYFRTVCSRMHFEIPNKLRIWFNELLLEYDFQVFLFQ